MTGEEEIEICALESLMLSMRADNIDEIKRDLREKCITSSGIIKSSAYCLLGDVYAYPEAVSSDLAHLKSMSEAVPLYEKAYEYNRSTTATFRLAEMYRCGSGISINFEKSHDYYLELASSNVPNHIKALSYQRLGIMNFCNQVHGASIEMAEEHFLKSIEYFNYVSIGMLGSVYIKRKKYFLGIKHKIISLYRIFKEPRDSKHILS